MDYFEFYNIAPQFHIDLNQLRKKFYEKSRELHPDISVQDDSIFLSAYNNQAYQTLLQPLSRLKYIIETFKGPIGENTNLLSQDFLMEMMELHEEVNESVLNKDESSLNNLRMQLVKMEEHALADAEIAIKSFDSGERNDSVFDGLITYYFKLKYFKRLQETLSGESPDV
jgi:molecular chaperone HscB